MLDLLGGISMPLLGLVFPSLAYLQATKGWVHLDVVDGKSMAVYRTACKCLAGFGCLLLVVVPAAVVVSIMRG